MRIYAAAVYLFLYAPITLIVLFSFNAGRHAASFECCATVWYGRTFNNTFLVEALLNSLMIAGTTAVLATLLGTMASLALQRVRGALRVLFDALTYIAIMIPGIVIGIATLVALVNVFDVVNPLIAELWSGDSGDAPSMKLGYGSIIAAHTMFTMALVIVIVRARIQGMGRSLIDLPPGDAPADLSRGDVRLPAQLHLQL